MKSNNLSLILAKKGSGKTTLATALAFCNDKPLFIISPNYMSIAHWELDKINDIDIDLEAMKKKKYSHLFYIEKDDFNEILGDLIQLESVCIFIDELDFYLGNRSDNEDAFFKLINYGRHKQNDLIAVSRRLQDIPKTLTSQMDTLYIGKIGLDLNDKKYLNSYLPSEVCDDLINLEQGDFYRVDLIKNKISYFHLSNEVSKILERRLNKWE